MPLAFSRTYRPSDPTSRSFGRGSRHAYDIDLWRPNISSYEGAAIILPNGQRIKHDCLNPDDPFLANLRFEHTESPGPFYQTTFTYNNTGQPLTVTDALNKTTTFAYTLGNLTSITSPLGNVETRFVDSGGRLLRITDPGGAMTRLQDGQGRIDGQEGGCPLGWSRPEGLSCLIPTPGTARLSANSPVLIPLLAKPR